MSYDIIVALYKRVMETLCLFPSLPLSLLLSPPLSLQFKSSCSKSVCVVGLMAMMADDPEHPDVFLLTDSEHGETLTPDP